MTKPEVICRIDWNKDYNRGKREGRLEAYKDILVFALESDYCDKELLIGLCKKELSSPSRRSLVQSTRRGGKE